MILSKFVVKFLRILSKFCKEFIYHKTGQKCVKTTLKPIWSDKKLKGKGPFTAFLSLTGDNTYATN